MKNLVGGLSVELHHDTIMIRDAKTLQLLRAKAINPNDAVETYNALIVTLKKKHLQKTFA